MTEKVTHGPGSSFVDHPQGLGGPGAGKSLPLGLKPGQGGLRSAHLLDTYCRPGLLHSAFPGLSRLSMVPLCAVSNMHVPVLHAEL